MKNSKVVLQYQYLGECNICSNRLRVDECVDEIIFGDVDFVRKSVVCCDHEYSIELKVEIKKDTVHIEKPTYEVGEFYKAKWKKDGSIEPIMYCANGYWLSFGRSLEYKDDSFSWIDSQPLNLGE